MSCSISYLDILYIPGCGPCEQTCFLPKLKGYYYTEWFEIVCMLCLFGQNNINFPDNYLDPPMKFVLK